jgi:hypothetical protein
VWSLLSAAMALAGTVQMDGTTLAALWEDPTQDVAASGFLVTSRNVEMSVVDHGVLVVATWQVQCWDDVPRSLTLTEGDVHVDTLSVDGAVRSGLATPQATAVVSGTGQHTVVLSGWIPKLAGIQLLAAATGTVHGLDDALSVTTAAGLSVTVDGVTYTGARELFVGPKPVVGQQRGDLATGQVAIGLTVEEGAIVGSARIRSVVRAGSIDRIRVRVLGLGSDIQVSGLNLGEWTRQGDVFDIPLVDAVTDSASVELRWVMTVGESLPVPQIEVLDVFRTESALQVARTGDITVSTDLDGWRAVPRADVPAWGRGLTDGAPQASFVGGSALSGTLTLLTFTPVAGPPVIVDVADWRLATTAEGRSLVRGLLEVRNERASHLRISPPPGMRLFAVQVGNEPALPIADGDAWLVPLTRSIETVEGLLSFPVEVSLLGQAPDWEMREQHSLRLPVVEAPVQVARVTLVLPPNYQDRHDDGGDRIDAFSEGHGITYGFGVGDVGIAQADALYQDAVDAWMSNDFRRAQEKLDGLEALGASNPNIYRLESNIAVVLGGSEDADASLSRRIRDQAQARSQVQERAWVEAQQLARAAEQRGDYATSGFYYQAAVEMGETLSLLESDGVEVSSGNAALKQELEEVERLRVQLRQASEDAGRWSGVPETDKLPWEVSSETPFDVEGVPWFLADESSGLGVYGVGAGGGGSGGDSSSGFGAVGDSSDVSGVGSIDPRMTLLERRIWLSKTRLSVGTGMESGAISRVVSTIDGVQSDRSRRGRGGLFGRRQSSAPPSFKQVEVHASALSLDIPVAGQIVRYQRLLLPESTPFAIDIDAKLTHPRRSR